MRPESIMRAHAQTCLAHWRTSLVLSILSPAVVLRCRSVLPFIVAALLTMTPAWSRGEWYDLYLDGLAAIENGRPRQAVTLIHRALELRGRGGYFRTYGNNYIRYAPHAYLGIAFHDSGACEPALAQFEMAERDGEPDGEPALASHIRSLAGACRARLEARARPEAGQPAPAPPEPPRLRAVDRRPFERGAAAYLSGDFDAAVEAFTSAVRLAPDSAVAHLLLASALDGLASTGDAPGTALQRCGEELRAALRIEPKLDPDPRFFSPRLLRLLEQSR